jgi:hypothetical protein
MMEFRLFERFAYFIQKSDVKIGTGGVQTGSLSYKLKVLYFCKCAENVGVLKSVGI